MHEASITAANAISSVMARIDARDEALGMDRDAAMGWGTGSQVLQARRENGTRSGQSRHRLNGSLTATFGRRALPI